MGGGREVRAGSQQWVLVEREDKFRSTELVCCLIGMPLAKNGSRVIVHVDWCFNSLLPQLRCLLPLPFTLVNYLPVSFIYMFCKCLCTIFKPFYICFHNPDTVVVIAVEGCYRYRI